MQRHHDIETDLLLHDPQLGTIGLVDFVPLVPREDVRATIDRLLDRAAYLRQLCLFEAESTGSLAYAVELVLVFAREHADGVAFEMTVERLRELARETGYLRTLGVSLLCEQTAGGYTARDLRRAFPWLLASTRKWFSQDPVRARAASEPAHSTWSVALKNYRNTAQRTYEFAGGESGTGRAPALHILHGYNGSGKTTFTEALELILTERIDRLGDPAHTDYYRVIRHRPRRQIADGPPVRVEGPTTVTLTAPNGSRSGITATATIAERIAAPPTDPPGASLAQKGITLDWGGSSVAPHLERSSSFRLDQAFMDDLIRSDEAKRATRFLEAFFPGERSTFQEMAAANAALAAALQKLPPASREVIQAVPADDPNPALLGWIDAPPSTWTAGILTTLAPILPFSEAQLDLLGSLEPSIRTLVNRWRQHPTAFTNLKSELKKLDDELGGLRKRLPEMMPHLRTADQFFTDFADWQSRKRVARGGAFEKTLNEWLELQALADLVGRYHDVLATLADARASGWHPAPQYEELFKGLAADPARLDLLKRHGQALRDRRDEARTAVSAWTEGQSGTSASRSTRPTQAPPRAHLAAAEKESLNLVCGWLPSLVVEGSAPLLGDLVVSVLDTGQPATRGRCTIGSAGGLKLAADETKALLAAIEAISPPDFSLSASLTALADVRAARERVIACGQRVRASFFSILASTDQVSNPLADALHELLALFKPAPWAYQEILFRARLRGSEAGGETEMLGLVADDLPAELRLNTAEMNSFTLALFLLCAPSLPNPLRLLVLDDPLQNMDEMTVSSLSRGLGRLIRIYPCGWRITALFHAEDDLHRVREAVPCAVYRLPWINPWSAKETRSIVEERQESTWRRDLQTITSFVCPRP